MRFRISKIGYIVSTLIRVTSFFICLLILVVRGWDRLCHPGIWAEEGSVFLADALNKGWVAIFQPYEGYYHLFGRVSLQFFATIFPLSILPTLVTASAFLLYAWVFSVFADSAYRHIVKSDLNRVVIAAGLCLTPGLPEILGNICNSHRILSVYVFFLGLLSIKENLKLRHLLMAFLAVGSAGEVLVLIPMFFYRLYCRYKISPALKAVRNDLILIFIILTWSALNIAARHTNTAHLNIDVGAILNANLAAFTLNFGLPQLAGWRMTGNIFNHAIVLFCLLNAIISFFLIKGVWRKINSDLSSLFIGIVCLFAIQELSWLVRPTDLYMYGKFFPGMYFYNYRYMFTLAFAGFLLWSVLLANRSKVLGIGYVLLVFILAPPLKVSAYGDVSYWGASAEKLERSIKTGCPKEVTVPIFPAQWKFTYHSPLTAVNCME